MWEADKEVRRESKRSHARQRSEQWSRVALQATSSGRGDRGKQGRIDACI